MIVRSASYLLHLELDGRLHFVHLVFHGLTVAEDCGKLSGLRQPRTKNLGDLLDQGIGCEESIVSLG